MRCGVPGGVLHDRHAKQHPTILLKILRIYLFEMIKQLTYLANAMDVRRNSTVGEMGAVRFYKTLVLLIFRRSTVILSNNQENVSAGRCTPYVVGEAVRRLIMQCQVFGG